MDLDVKTSVRRMNRTKPMFHVSYFFMKLISNKLASVGCIVLLSELVAYLVYISRPELLLDVFNAFPIMLGLGVLVGYPQGGIPARNPLRVQW